MSTGWIAPGSTESTDLPSTGRADGPPDGGPSGNDGRSAPAGPRRELVQNMPLFPLRPLGLGEVLGAAVRIYRLRARTVLGLAAIVYGIAFAIMMFTTGAGMIPFVGDMQAMMDDPTASSSASVFSGSDLLLTIGSSAITGVITMIAASLVTVALTAVSIGEATGRSLTGAEMWARTRKLAVSAICVSIVIGLLSLLLLALPTALGILPIVLVQEPNALTIGAIVVGLVIGVVAALWIWARTLLAIPALVVEGTGILGALRRSFQMTRGRKLWRVLGVGVLLYALYSIALQVVAGVFSTVAVVVYLAIMLATSGQAVVVGMIVLTVLTLLGSYVAYVMLSPFLCAGFAAVYADNRMRHEAWDIELTRRARENWSTGGVR
ncbi:MAG: glycerophosphoryl diester phosphodiesterase membrane domain-containing protein [Brachybacterium tyrofermentans]|uniref:glycerophosphoryl diester phosphodiesterase membrane domain-containing protein n=1 Tax=Brachybacterium tyrofermentans TaxID=47848 RepID=UPI000A1AC70B|nr:glycerophosphoryl diester phosphodiesterase membrane domain-containing protein [Brachybacterium tyrofermentans]SLN02566.1 membrane protein [Corynebacterium xerosis]